MYSIGKLANISNVSVRTLRYYHEIGLLLPSAENEAGHRFYADRELTKLHHILTLKDLGFPLETIQQILSSHDMNLPGVLSMRLKMIQAEQENLRKMEQTITSLLKVADLEQSTDWHTVFSTFFTFPNSQVMLKELWSNYFSSEEQRILADFPNFADGSSQTKKWVQLVNDVRANLHEPPKSPAALSLAKRWTDMVEQMYQGNTELAEKVWAMSKSEEGNLGFYQFDPEIVAFIEQAILHYKEKRELA